MSADAAAAPLSANSEAAAGPVLGSANTRDGGSQWYVPMHAWIRILNLVNSRDIELQGYLK